MASSNRPLIYAGIGARKTPFKVLGQMQEVARQLDASGWLLRSGAAEGADSAFAAGARPGRKEIHLPWQGYNGVHADGRDNFLITPTTRMADIAAANHPNWDNLKIMVKLFMVRNTTIILGRDLDSYVRMVICWTENGRLTGGTAHGIRIAHAFDIPVFNIALAEDQERLIRFVENTENMR
jgi:hypothetical protein